MTDGTRRNASTHRVVYEHHHGPVPEGFQIDHLCRQKDCCEITHLEAVTPGENWMRGTGPAVTRARFAAVTHCPKGHEYTPENTRIIPSGGYRTRSCRQCERERARLACACARVGEA